MSVLEDETAESVTKHLLETYQHYASIGIVIKRVLTDNGSGYRSKMFAEACQTLNVNHVFTKPYTPQTNGKAERFIQTLLRKWACTRTYTSSVQRNMFLETFLHMYNWQRPHRGINGFSPVRRNPLMTDTVTFDHAHLVKLMHEYIDLGFAMAFAEYPDRVKAALSAKRKELLDLGAAETTLNAYEGYLKKVCVGVYEADAEQFEKESGKVIDEVLATIFGNARKQGKTIIVK